MANKTRFSMTALLTIGLVGFSAADVAQAFNMGNMMNPSRWFGGNSDRYRDRDYDYGGPGYGWGGPGYGYGGPYGGPGYGYGGPGFGYGGPYGGPGYGGFGGPGYGYGGPGYGYGGGGPGYGYGGPGYAPEPVPQGAAPGYEAQPPAYR
jgi:hypothetical protein